MSSIATRMKCGTIFKLAKFELREPGTSEFFLYLNFSSVANPPSSSELTSHKVLKFKINIFKKNSYRIVTVYPFLTRLSLTRRLILAVLLQTVN